MPSNRVVTYIDIKLNSIEEYWSELVVANVKVFRGEPSPRSLFNAAHSIWHLHDWVWHDRNPGKDSRGAAFDNYRNGLLTACPELGWLRDIADAGKHRGLGRRGVQIAGAEPRLVHGFYVPAIDITESRWRYCLVLNDDTQQDVEPVLRKAIEFWRSELNNKNLFSPFDQA